MDTQMMILSGTLGFVILCYIYQQVKSNKLPEKVKDFKKFKKIGEGSFGEVYVWKNKKNDQLACKEVTLQSLQMTSRQDPAMQLQNEIKILRTLNHINIVMFVEFHKDDTKLYMFMERMEVSVTQLLERRHRPFAENEAKLYTRDILKGLIYLHDHNVIHCDIKGANVLLKEGKVAKLADFGLAKYYDETRSLRWDTYILGTVNYISPELRKEMNHSRKSDVWAVGCTIYAMLLGAPPFADLPMKAVEEKTKNLKQWDAVEDSGLRGSTKDFLQDIFVEKGRRPSAQNLTTHDWMNN